MGDPKGLEKEVYDLASYYVGAGTWITEAGETTWRRKKHIAACLTRALERVERKNVLRCSERARILERIEQLTAEAVAERMEK